MRKLLADLQEETTGRAEAHTTPVSPDDDLFDLGLLTSLTVVRVMAAMESWSGTEIELERYGLEAFFTLSRLYEVFLDTVDRREGAL